MRATDAGPNVTECPTHGAIFPAGEVCPGCEIDVEERLRVLQDVDECACQRCGAGAEKADIAADPQWFIDAYLEPSNDAQGFKQFATIYCPRCW